MGHCQGCALAQEEDVEAGAEERWPGQWGDEICDRPGESSVSQGMMGQNTFER